MEAEAPGFKLAMLGRTRYFSGEVVLICGTHKYLALASSLATTTLVHCILNAGPL